MFILRGNLEGLIVFPFVNLVLNFDCLFSFVCVCNLHNNFTQMGLNSTISARLLNSHLYLLFYKLS